MTESSTTIFSQVNKCKDLSSGKTFHSEAIKFGLPSTTFAYNTFLNMYSRLSKMVDAQHLFDLMPHRNTVTWNSLIQGYVHNGQSYQALLLFNSMQEILSPDARTYVALLSACTNLANTRPGEQHRWLVKGRDLHNLAASSGLCDLFVKSTLVNMYSQCGCMTEARTVFDAMTERNLVSWNSLIQGYAKSGEMVNARKVFNKMVRKNVVSWFNLIKGYVNNEEYELGVDAFEAMHAAGCTLDERLYVAAVTACGGLSARTDSALWLEKGRSIHSRAVNSGSCNMYVESSLVDMYSKFGCMETAKQVFDRMAEKDTVSWNFLIQGYSQSGDMTLATRVFEEAPEKNVLSWHCLIRGYVTNGENEKALEVFERMEKSLPDERVYAAALSACANLAERGEYMCRRAKEIHFQAVENQRCDITVEGMLVDVYAKSGNMKQARLVFDRMTQRTTSTWNLLVRGYIEAGESQLGLELITSMSEENVLKDSATYVAGLLACGELQLVERGEEFHSEITSLGLDKDPVLQTCLVEFYGRCGRMEVAENVFGSMNTGKDIMSWNALMRGYSREGESSRVFGVLERMKEGGVGPNEMTFTYLLTTCSHAGLTERGRQCFEEMVGEYGLCPRMEHYACMVDMMGRVNQVEEALSFVRGMPVEANVVVWHALLSACRKWKNVEVGRVAYLEVLRLDERDGCSYVLMADISR